MALRAPSLSCRRLEALWKEVFYCPACSTWRKARLYRDITSPRVNWTVKKRTQSTLVSSTALNASKKIPTRYVELHGALQSLQKKAPAHVNQSRLQLALSGLETEIPTTRLAILGVNRSVTAKRVVRLLLADSLQEEASWERQLDTNDAAGEEDTGAVLIRYGESVSPTLLPSRTAIPTISIPSPILQRNNVEILVSSVFSPGKEATSVTDSDTFLTPFAGTPTSASGREVIVSFPVHKTMVLGDGLGDFQALSEMLTLTAYEAPSEKTLVSPALNLNGCGSSLRNKRLVVFDISRVDQQLKRARESIQHTAAYQESWSESGLPQLKDWLTESSLKSDDESSRTLVQVVDSIIDAATASIEKRVAAVRADEEAGFVKPETRERLDEAVDSFITQGHLELQTGLARAFESRSWKKLAWYKLLWRVDDVPLIITDIAQQYWLRESSVLVFEMMGRLHQAGLISFVSYDGRLVEFATTNGQEPPLHLQPVLVQSSSDYLEVPEQPVLKSSELTRAREHFLSTTIPTMTATAQATLIKAVGFSASTAALSALSYFSTVTPSLYECGAILALGTVFALRRLQNQWESSRREFRANIFDVGRSALKSTEEFMRLAIREGGHKEVDEVERKTGDEALEAVEGAKRAINRLR